MKKHFLQYAAALIAVFVGIVLVIDIRQSPKDDISASELTSWEKTNSTAQNILIIGLDKFEHVETANAYLNNQQADFLLLLSVDYEQDVCKAIPINRDTMSEITRLGVFGDAVETFTGQLALAHTYGSGGSDSAVNTVKAVSNLLRNLPIDHYITFTMDAVSIANDLVGGVTVTIEDDFPAEYNRLKRGTKVTLQGEEALAYVRGRKAVGDQTNLNRMARQKNYMEQFFLCLKQKSDTGPDFMEASFSSLGGSFQSDFSLSQINELVEKLSAVSQIEFLEITGRSVKGKESIEFYPDSESIEECVQRVVMQ